MTKKYCIILNPAAGRGATVKALPVIEEFLTENQVEYEVVQTQYPGHAIELANNAAHEGASVVVAVGGDGTANEVINGLMQAKNDGNEIPAMAVIAIGRGNDFAFSMKVPMELQENLQALYEDHRKAIDVGHVVLDGEQGRFFGNCIGIGFDAEVGFVAVKLKPLSGFINYIVAAILTNFIYFKAPEILLQYEGQERRMSSLMVSIMNGIRLGGGFYMTPDSENNDGLFDVCVVTNPNRMRVLALMPHFMKGSQISQPEVDIVRTGKVGVFAISGTLPAHVDGETLCKAGNQMEVEILQRQIELVCSPS